MEDEKDLGEGKTCFIIAPIGSKLEPPGSAGRSRYEESAFIALTVASDEGATGTAKFRGAVRQMRGFSRDLRPSLQILDRATSRFLEGLGIMSGWRAPLEQSLE